MKIFHLSDLHIGVKLHNQDLAEEQEYVFAQIIEQIKERQPDVIVIAGDIYDKAVPTAEAVKLFDAFMENMYRAAGDGKIMLISGNHDSAQRIDCFRWALEKDRMYLVGLPPLTKEERIEKVVVEDAYGEVNFYLLPYVRPALVRNVLEVKENQSLSYDEALHLLIEREQIDTTKRNVLVSHQFYLPRECDPENIERTDSEVQSVGNVDVVYADAISDFDYAALGHIHKPMTVGLNHLRYCGTPFAYSVSEAGQEKGMLEITLGKKGEPVQIEKIVLKPKHQVRVIKGTLEEVLQQSCEDFVSVVLTGETEFESFDLNEKLGNAFPRLLEIRRERMVRDVELEELTERFMAGDLEPFELICEFVSGELDEEEQTILREVINELEGVGE